MRDSNKIYLLNGPVHSGKTTGVMQWLSSRQNAAGILAPIKDGKRYLMNVETGEEKLLERSPLNKKDRIIIGSYTFDKQVFEWGNEVLMNAIENGPEWIIIDEIGPLELNGSGLEPAVSFVINKKINGGNFNLLLVVREGLSGKCISHYGLAENSVLLFKI